MEGVLAQVRSVLVKFSKIMVVKHRDLLKLLEDKTVWMLESFLHKRDEAVTEINTRAPLHWRHPLDADQLRRRLALFLLHYRAVTIRLSDARRRVATQISMLNDNPVITERRLELEKKAGDVSSTHSTSRHSTRLLSSAHFHGPASLAQSPPIRHKRVSIGNSSIALIHPNTTAQSEHEPDDRQTSTAIRISPEEDEAEPKIDYTFGKQ